MEVVVNLLKTCHVLHCCSWLLSIFARGSQKIWPSQWIFNWSNHMLAFHISTLSVKCIHWSNRYFPRGFTKQFKLAFTSEFNDFGIFLYHYVWEVVGDTWLRIYSSIFRAIELLVTSWSSSLHRHNSSPIENL